MPRSSARTRNERGRPGKPEGFLDGAGCHAFQFVAQGTGDVRGQQDIWVRVEAGVRWQDPRGGDIQHGIDITALHPRQQGALVDEVTPRGVDERGSGAEPFDPAGVDEVLGGGERRRVEGHDVAARHELVQGDELDADRGRLGGVEVGVGHHDVKLVRSEQADDMAPDLGSTDDPDALAVVSHVREEPFGLDLRAGGMQARAI